MQVMDDIYSLHPKEKVKKLQTLPLHVQRSKEWFEARKTRITASEAASVLIKNDRICDPYIETYKLDSMTKVHGKKSYYSDPDIFEKNDKKNCNPYSNKKEFILKKLGKGKPFVGNVATRHGQKFEQVAQDIYSRLKGEKIIEFGLINHPEHSYIGASPDGITESGVMLEIKCPFRRVPTGIPPFHYWIQVQLQLQCCYKLDECDFVECVIKSYNDSEDFMNDYDLYNGQEKGIILEIMGSATDWENAWYVYPPTEMTDPIELLEWADKEQKRHQAAIKIQSAFRKEESIARVKKICWKLEDVKITNIKRNDAWFEVANKVFCETWNEVECLLNATSQSVPSEPSGFKQITLFDLFKKEEKKCIIED